MLRNLNQTKPRGRICGTPKSGVLGSLIPSTGVHGAAYAYASLALPADSGKEICGYITTWPVGLTTFDPTEDTAFSAAAPDGTYTLQFQLQADGVDVGTPRTATLTFGDGTIACLVGDAVAGGPLATINHQTVIACAPGNAVASGPSATITSGSTTTINCSVGDGVAGGPAATILQNQVIACAVGDASAAGLAATITFGQRTVISCTVGNAVAAGKLAQISVANGAYVRAPEGNGYHPHLNITPDRPAAAQGVER